MNESGKEKMGERNLVLVGSGGCMRELLWQIEERNREGRIWNVLGYVDKKPYEGNEFMELHIGGICCPYLGDDDFLLSRRQETNVVISVGDSLLRRNIAEKLKKNPRLKFPNLILGNTKICQDVRMGQGCIVSMDCRISTGVILGDFVFLNIGSLVCHDGSIGDFTTLSPDVKLAGKTVIGSQCNIGLGSRIIQGIKVGNNVIVGAGSIIVKDIQGDCTVAGVPARKMGSR